MNKKLIIAAIVTILVIIVLYFALTDRASTFTEESQLTSATGVATSANSSILESEAVFLSQIQQLQRIDLSRSALLKYKSFTRLQDNTVPLSDIDAGRPNPFMAIDARVARERAKDILKPVESTVSTNPTPEADAPAVVEADIIADSEAVN